MPETFRFMIPITGFGGICALLLLSLHFSDDYIPSAWSDFPFWTQLFTEKKEAFLSLLNHPLYYADSRMLGSLAGILVTTVGVCGILMTFYMIVFKGFRCEKRARRDAHFAGGWALFIKVQKEKRSGRDLNPRSLAALLLSRQMPSANSTTAA